MSTPSSLIQLSLKKNSKEIEEDKSTSTQNNNNNNNKKHSIIESLETQQNHSQITQKKTFLSITLGDKEIESQDDP